MRKTGTVLLMVGLQRPVGYITAAMPIVYTICGGQPLYCVQRQLANQGSVSNPLLIQIHICP